MSLSFYQWLAGTESGFLQHFQYNENLYAQAQDFWSQLNGAMVFVFIAMIAVGFLTALFYYVPYNNIPGRHYRISHWVLFLVISFVVTLFLTLGIEYGICEPQLDGAFALEFKVALVNALYAAILYFITSVIWCNIGYTNAYRIFKF